MPKKRKDRLFGLFDEQAISILAVLTTHAAKFGQLIQDTRLSKASLSRILNSLEAAAVVKKAAHGYMATKRGKRIFRLILDFADEDSKKALTAIDRRLCQMEADYYVDGRIFHTDPKWERTAEKPLIEVMPMRSMTGVESLLFQQRFIEEITREEQKLRHSKGRA